MKCEFAVCCCTLRKNDTQKPVMPFWCVHRSSFIHIHLIDRQIDRSTLNTNYTHQSGAIVGHFGKYSKVSDDMINATLMSVQ